MSGDLSVGTDLTGGLGVEREHVFAERPDEPEMRDAVNMWVVDDRGQLGLPRFAVEALASEWHSHDVRGNVGFPDGRMLRFRTSGPPMPTAGPDGAPTVFGAGPLVFRCEEPFRRWTASFDGTAVQTSTSALIDDDSGEGPTVDLAFEVEATMAVPPWIQGSLLTDAAAVLAGSEGKLMGGDRYEQLFRARGTLRVGDEEQTFTGTGLRIRRQGVRDITEFWGHAWQSALFPSGRAFGYIAYPPRDDGRPTYNEGYLFEGDGELIPARVVQAPWLSELRPNGEDVSVVLESERGTVSIEGRTILSNIELGLPDIPQFPVLQQAGVRYVWDGEETYGMLERSSRRDRIRWD